MTREERQWNHLRAVWNGTVIAESSDTVVVEGNHYFPPNSVNWELLEPTVTTSICPWKGSAVEMRLGRQRRRGEQLARDFQDRAGQNTPGSSGSW